MPIILAPVFSNGVILQREMPVPVWGISSPGVRITVSVQGASVSCVADDQGAWRCALPALVASDSEVLVVESADERVEVSDVAVGEVFVAAGEAEMAFPMRDYVSFPSALRLPRKLRIRFCELPAYRGGAQGEGAGRSEPHVWHNPTKEELGDFFAISYYFARELDYELGVPVGVVGCACGDARASAWMAPEHARKMQPDPPAGAPAAGDSPAHDPGAAYTHMVLPLAPFAVRGVLWYQGESDGEDPSTASCYRDALETVIDDWRAAWARPDLPFFVVQLPGSGAWPTNDARDWVTVRAAQQDVADNTHNVWLCSIGDVNTGSKCDVGDKWAPGNRLALLALRHLYGQDILADAPRCTRIWGLGGNISFTFENAGEYLVIRNLGVRGLEVICRGRQLPFKAETRGDELIIKTVQRPDGDLEVRFAQENDQTINLTNSEGIPALPFVRTIKLITWKKRGSSR